MDMVQVRFSQPPSDKEKTPAVSRGAKSPSRRRESQFYPPDAAGVSLLIDTAMFEEERMSLPHTVERDPIIAE